MSFHLRCFSIAACVALLAILHLPATAQTGNGAMPALPAETAVPEQRQPDDLAEAARVVNGPAGNPECVWLGRRVIAAMSRDDLDTAYRHLEIYDRFGCPGPHIQASFRCVIRQGAIETDAQHSLSARAHACWLNPSAPAIVSAPASASTGSASR